MPPISADSPTPLHHNELLMLTVIKRLPLIFLIMLMVALSCSVLSVECTGFTDQTSLNTPTPDPTALPPIGPVVGLPDPPDYTANYCANTLLTPDNPFRGWPTSDSSFWGDSWISAGGRFCDPAYGQTWEHEGIDFLYWLDTPVIATAETLVIAAGWDDMMGNYIQLCSGIAPGWCIRYMHLSRITINAWDTATHGQLLGYVGGTGLGAGGDLTGSNGRVHLHYDMTNNNIFHDPYPTLR